MVVLILNASEMQKSTLIGLETIGKRSKIVEWVKNG